MLFPLNSIEIGGDTIFAAECMPSELGHEFYFHAIFAKRIFVLYTILTINFIQTTKVLYDKLLNIPISIVF